MKMYFRSLGCGFSTLILSVFYSSVLSAQSSDQGAALYQQRCATCHDQAEDYTPPKSTFSFRSPGFVIETLSNGAMQAQAQGLSEQQIQSIAMYITGKPLNAESHEGDDWDINYCSFKPKPITENDFHWNGWAGDVLGSRFQENTKIKAEDVSKLKVKWAFAYPSGRVNSQPTIVGDRVFVASRPGLLFSLDANTGCTHWAVEVDSGARASVVVGKIPNTNPPQYTAYVGTRARNVYSLDIDTGKTLWVKNIETHSRSGITGAPIIAGEKLIVPLSSLEEAAARDEKYECCTFRGSVVALDRSDGKMLWKSYTLDEEAKPFRKSRTGTQMYGPAGAAIWSAPSYDEKRQLIYAATGDSYTDVVESGSDAVVAFDVNTGKMMWRNQVTEEDNYVIGCAGEGHSNCPENLGPDFDFGSTPIIHNYKNADGEQKTLVLTGQKSGIIYAMDPDKEGEIVWQQRPGVGSVRGGIQWGSASDGEQIYTAISDSIAPPENRRPGVSAFDIVTGELRWHTPALAGECSIRGDRMTCTNGHSSAISVIPGAVFSGTLNGIFHAYSTVDGKELLRVNMNELRVDTVNGISASGGSMDATGPTFANGKLFVNSGYGGIQGQPGNVLLVYSVDGK